MPAVRGPAPVGHPLAGVHLSGLDYLAAAAAALGAGIINAVAGGGTLVSFPALIAIGIPAVPSNVTNTVSLLPGYLAGSWAQRRDLAPQLAQARSLTGVSAIGGLAGSVLLVALPASYFRSAVPFLILVACALLLAQDRLRSWATAGLDDDRRSAGIMSACVFAAAAYGGFFGAGLGIMLLAILGLFSSQSLPKTNALKQALSFVINLVAAVFFLFSGRVVWSVVPIMAVGSLLGGLIGGRLVPVIPERLLRALVVLAGVAVAISFWS